MSTLAQSAAPALSFFDRHGANMIANGYRILPIGPGQKAPQRFVSDTWQMLPGWQRHCERATTQAELDTWRTWPGAGIGIACGNVVGIDIDVLDPTLAHDIGALATTMLGETPLVRIGQAPKRLHVYRAGVPFRGRKRHPIEVLALGNQFVACAIHPGTGQPYEWINEHPAQVDVSSLPEISEGRALAFLDAAHAMLPLDIRPASLSGATAPAAQRVGNTDPRGTLEAVTSALAHIPNDDLDGASWIRVGLAIKGALGEDGRQLWIDWSRQSTKSGSSGKSDTPERRWQGLLPTDIGAGSIYHMAQERGWKPEPHVVLRASVAEAAATVDTSQMLDRLTRQVSEPLPEPANDRAPRRMLDRLEFPADCDAAPDCAYVVKHLLAAGDVAVLLGHPSSGKSVLAPHLGYAVAQGRPAFGLRTTPGRVLYVAAENASGMRKRVAALKRAHGDTRDFAILDIGNLSDGREAAELLASVAEWSPSLVIIDTLAAGWAGIDENSPEGMGAVVKLSRQLAASGAAVLLIHHPAKTGDTPRGHGCLNGTLDMVLSLAPKDRAGVIRGRLGKNRNGSCDREFAFRIEAVALRMDADGEPSTAPRAIELDADEAQDAGMPRLSPRETRALTILRGLNRDRAGVLEPDWRAACDEARVCASTNAGNRSKAIAATLKSLCDKRAVMSVKGRLHPLAAAGDTPEQGAASAAEGADRNDDETVPADGVEWPGTDAEQPRTTRNEARDENTGTRNRRNREPIGSVPFCSKRGGSGMRETPPASPSLLPSNDCIQPRNDPLRCPLRGLDDVPRARLPGASRRPSGANVGAARAMSRDRCAGRSAPSGWQLDGKWMPDRMHTKSRIMTRHGSRVEFLRHSAQIRVMADRCGPRRERKCIGTSDFKD